MCSLLHTQKPVAAIFMVSYAYPGMPVHHIGTSFESVWANPPWWISAL